MVLGGCHLLQFGAFVMGIINCFRYEDALEEYEKSKKGNPMTSVLDKLDELEKAGTPKPWDNTKSTVFHEGCVTIAVSRQGTDPEFSEQDAELIAYSRNHLRALIDVAREAEKTYKEFVDIVKASNQFCDSSKDEVIIDESWPHWRLGKALKKLEGE